MSYHQFQMFEKIGTEESQIETSIELSEIVNLMTLILLYINPTLRYNYKMTLELLETSGENNCEMQL